jgi:hypothetical protein
MRGGRGVGGICSITMSEEEGERRGIEHRSSFLVFSPELMRGGDGRGSRSACCFT